MESVINSITHLSDMQHYLRAAHKHAVLHGFPEVAGEILATMQLLDERYWAAQQRAMALTAQAASLYLRALSEPPVAPRRF